MNAVVYSARGVSPGDVVAYPATRGKTHMPVPPNDRDWLTVTAVSGRSVLGKRLHPKDWERDVEFVVIGAQIEANGLRVASSTAPEAQPEQRDSGDAQSASCAGETGG